MTSQLPQVVVLRVNFDCQNFENSKTLEAYNSKNTPPSDLKPGSKDADDLVDAKKRVFSEKIFRFKVEKRQKLKDVFFDFRQKSRKSRLVVILILQIHTLIRGIPGNAFAASQMRDQRKVL